MLRGRFPFLIAIGYGFLLAAAPQRQDLLSTASVRSSTHPGESLAIVLNRANPILSLSNVELRHVFLGERGHWPSGHRITLVMMEPGQPEREAMIHEICQMTENQYTNHFLHGLFTGEVLVSPKTLSSPEGVREFIFNVPGAIGYLRASDVDSSVKVLRVGELYPDDKNYPFHVPARISK
jgi:ABC-type phosphate transport system substrate-binding protein